MQKNLSLLAGSFALALSASALAQTTWDLPSAYPAS
ncbi:MAG TPA: C4-dicarboxylate ABC transporter substrate-binding protein, partial [Bordetella sp.]|nr:C4-dicarboxylate ABC transporter substrate-binding protein [Bordetella sp.]